MGFFKKALKGISGALKIATFDYFGFGLLKDAFQALLPKIPKPPSGLANGKTYNANVRVNDAALGDIKTVVYGRVRHWPNYCSMPYREFAGNLEVFCAYLHGTVGMATVEAIYIGDTPVTSLASVQTEVLLPGQSMSLIKPNVYTNPDLDGADLVSGALDSTDDPDRIIVPKVHTSGDDQVTTSTAGTLTANRDGFFDDFLVGDVVRVYDLDPDYTGTVLAITDNGRTLTTDPPPARNSIQDPLGVFVQQRWAGPFIACPAGATTSTIAIDLQFTGIFDDDHDANSMTLDFVLQYRPVDDVGNVLDLTWRTINFSLTDNQRTPRRITRTFPLVFAMRPQVRLWRSNDEENDGKEVSSGSWKALKGIIFPLAADHPTVDPISTRIAVRVQASSQLSQQSENRLSVVMQRLLPVYEAGAWTTERATRNPVWAVADWLTSEHIDEDTGQTYQLFTHADLDVDRFVEVAAICETNGDTFDAVFDHQVGFWEAAQSILRVCRGTPVFDMITRKVTIVLDEATDPVQLFCDGFNAQCGADSIDLPDHDTPSGVRCKFIEPLTWTSREGPLVGDGGDPREPDFFGCTAWAKAYLEALYEDRVLVYRTHTVPLDVEMEGLLPLRGQRVLICSAEKGWGQGAEVTDADGRTLQVWPAPFWRSGLQHHVYLQGLDGKPGAKILCSRGATDAELVLASDPDVELRVDGDFRTLAAFGYDGDGVDIDPDAPRIAIVQDRSTSGPRSGTLTVLFDHPAIYEPAGTPPPDPYALGGGTPIDLTVHGLTATQISSSGYYATEDGGARYVSPSGAHYRTATGAPSAFVHVTWTPVAGASGYLARWRYSTDTAWTVASSGISTTVDIGVTHNGTVEIEVTAHATASIGPAAITSVVIDAF